MSIEIAVSGPSLPDNRTFAEKLRGERLYVPRANLLYSPRNKILATSLLIEAFLYEEQTRRGVSIKHWQEFEDVADHCTVCHKCLSPCPVKIDFGDVSIDGASVKDCPIITLVKGDAEDNKLYTAPEFAEVQRVLGPFVDGQSR